MTKKTIEEAAAEARDAADAAEKKAAAMQAAKEKALAAGEAQRAARDVAFTKLFDAGFAALERASNVLGKAPAVHVVDARVAGKSSAYQPTMVTPMDKIDRELFVSLWWAGWKLGFGRARTGDKYGDKIAACAWSYAGGPLGVFADEDPTKIGKPDEWVHDLVVRMLETARG